MYFYQYSEIGYHRFFSNQPQGHGHRLHRLAELLIFLLHEEIKAVDTQPAFLAIQLTIEWHKIAQTLGS